MNPERLRYLRAKLSETEAEVQEFFLGQRVRFSELGKVQSPKSAKRVGTVVGLPATSSVDVLLDGNKSPTKLHRSYIELDQDEMSRRLEELGLTAKK